MRIGMGYDIHRFAADRKLILGGVEIAHDRGLLGHSDADVLIHAVCDALLGAAGMGDIGLHFPDTDIQYKDADSMLLLKRVGNMLTESGFNIVNIDATIMAERPKISPHRLSMQKNISSTLNMPSNLINIKATTAEGLGPVGRAEGIAAMCIAMLSHQSPRKSNNV